MMALWLLGCIGGGFGGGEYWPGDSAWLLREIGVDPVSEDLWVIDFGLEPQDSGWGDTAGSSSETQGQVALYRVHGESHGVRRMLELPDYDWIGVRTEFVTDGVVLADYRWNVQESSDSQDTALDYEPVHGLVPRKARGITQTLEGGWISASPTGEFLLHDLDDGGVVLVSADFSTQRPLEWSAVDWTADGLLRTQDASGQLELWDPDTLSLVRTLRLPPFMGEAAAWRLRPDMQQAVAVPKDGAGKQGVYVVDLAEGGVRFVRGVPRSGRYNADGSAWIADLGEQVFVADTETWVGHQVSQAEDVGAWVTPGGGFLVMEDPHNETVQVLDLSSETLATQVYRSEIGFLPVVVGDALWWSAGQGQIRTLYFDTGELVEWSPDCGFQGGIAWQPNSDRVVLRCWDRLNFYERESFRLVDSVVLR